MNPQDVQKELEKIEKTLIEKTEALEQETGNDKNQVTSEGDASTGSLLDTVRSIGRTLARHWEAEAALLIQKAELEKQIEFQHSTLAEMKMEQDVLLERLHSYLKTNSSLKIRLEEQRCQTAALQRQLEGGTEDLQRSKNNFKLVLEESSKCLAEEELDRVRKSLDEAKRREEEATSKLKEVLEEKSNLEQENKNLRNIGLASISRRENEGWRKWKSAEDIRHGAKSSPFAEFSPKDSKPRGNSSRPKTTDDQPKVSEIAVQDQLNALKSGLVYVTQKLKLLKSQIANSNTLREEAQEEESKKPRNLKRKAEVFEQPVAASDVQEPQKAFKNLKDILEDAKNLNAKLQTLREEKQRMLEGGGVPEKEKQEKGSQTAAPMLLQLKNSVTEFEEKLDDGLITREEAYGGLISALSTCVFGEGKGVGSQSACRQSQEVEKEDGGGGDSLSKVDLRGKEHLKLQIARLKAKMEHFHN